MYAIVEAGGKQHKVEVNSVFKTELLHVNQGDKVTLKTLMLVDGNKVMAGEKANTVKVVAEVLENGKDKKIVVFKYKPKKNERKKQGHRQPYTKLKVLEINAK